MIKGLNQTPGATPIDPNELEGLIPNAATQADLNEFERLNILVARRWAFSPRVLSREDPLAEAYQRTLHKKMFEDVWEWAGVYRTTEKNIGCLAIEITQRIPVLVGNARYWLEYGVFDLDEIAVRFHHAMVGSIHPFANGNGRHARLVADVIVVKNGRPEFTWGSSAPSAISSVRERYLAALAAADNGDIQPLLKFARS
ncbi:MAG: mobile mystery protein B [Candidatus Acidiferrum sp.]